MSLPRKVRLAATLRKFASIELGRLKRWSFTLGEFVLVQVMVQAISALAGLLTVRWLDKQDYAFYIIGLTWLIALMTLSNSGIANAATALGGRVWQDRHRLGQVIASALLVRRWLVVATVLPLMAILVWTLALNGAGAGTIAAIAAAVTVGSLFQLNYSILVVVPRLRKEIRSLQLQDSVGGLIRLALTVLAALIYFDAVVAIMITVAAYGLQYAMVRAKARAGADLQARPEPEAIGSIRKVVQRQWLNEVNGVFQGQLSIILLSFFGTAARVADLGALGRIGVLFAVLMATMQSIVLPHYSRCHDAAQLRQLYLRIVGGCAVLSLAPVLLCWLWPGPFLWLLGSKYQGLSYELTLVALNTGLAAMVGITWNLNATRAWIVPGWLLVPCGLALQFILMVAIGVSTLPQVLFIGIFSSVLGIAINVGTTLIFTRGFSRF